MKRVLWFALKLLVGLAACIGTILAMFACSGASLSTDLPPAAGAITDIALAQSSMLFFGFSHPLNTEPYQGVSPAKETRFRAGAKQELV
jgi:hypothetical protein